jgi:hypothetical protein
MSIQIDNRPTKQYGTCPKTPDIPGPWNVVVVHKFDTSSVSDLRSGTPLVFGDFGYVRSVHSSHVLVDMSLWCDNEFLQQQDPWQQSGRLIVVLPSWMSLSL